MYTYVQFATNSSDINLKGFKEGYGCFAHLPPIIRSNEFKPYIYICFNSIPRILDFVEHLNSRFSNIKITIEDVCYVGYEMIETQWGSQKQLVENTEDFESVMPLIKIEVSEEYTKLARIVVLNMVAVILRMLHYGEGFINSWDKHNEEKFVPTLEAVCNVSNFCWVGRKVSKVNILAVNSNHILSENDSMTEEELLALDNVNLMNSLFDKSVDCPTQYKSMHTITENSGRVMQTPVFNYIRKNIKED